MKTLIIIYLLMNGLLVYSQNTNPKYFYNENLTYYKPNLNSDDSVITKGTEMGMYYGAVDIPSDCYFNFLNDTVFVKGRVKNYSLVNKIYKDLKVYFWTFESIKNNIRELKLKKYYGQSTSNGSFTLAIPLNTEHPIYFFSNTLSPLCFNYPKFKQSAIFKKVKKSKGWVKYNL